MSLKDKELIIQIPDELSDAVLIEDLFDYILPAGITYVITRVGDYSEATNETRVLLSSDKVAAAKIEIGGIDASSYIYEALPAVEKEKIPGAGQYLGTLDSTLVPTPSEEEKVDE